LRNQQYSDNELKIMKNVIPALLGRIPQKRERNQNMNEREYIVYLPLIKFPDCDPECRKKYYNKANVDKNQRYVELKPFGIFNKQPDPY